MHKLCLKAPKYGNGIEEVDSIGAEIFTYIADEIEKYNSKFGKMTPGILPVSGNTPFGLEVGALPSGRKAWVPLADGISPQRGTDVYGPSAVLKSASKIPHGRFVQGTLLNMKLEPSFLESENGLKNLMALLKSMCSLGVYHVQFNIVNHKMLIKLRNTPKITKIF